jgi:hypothetical protein
MVEGLVFSLQQATDHRSYRPIGPRNIDIGCLRISGSKLACTSTGRTDLNERADGDGSRPHQLVGQLWCLDFVQLPWQDS